MSTIPNNASKHFFLLDFDSFRAAEYYIKHWVEKLKKYRGKGTEHLKCALIFLNSPL
jgi:hypothetical protein